MRYGVWRDTTRLTQLSIRRVAIKLECEQNQRHSVELRIGMLSHSLDGRHIKRWLFFNGKLHERPKARSED